MADAIPFSITPDAEDFLRERIKDLPRAAQPVLMMAMNQSDGLKPPRWSYEGESFILGYFDPGEKPKMEYSDFDLLGRTVAIESDALKHLSGCALSLRRVKAHSGLLNVSRYVMVANSTAASPNPAGGDEGSVEKTQRYISIAALAVLGGFAGLGVSWLGYCLLAIALRIPEDKLFDSRVIVPMFSAGVIIGAIVSFFFFRSVYKSNGRTQFAREQRRKKYLGTGGLQWEMDKWIFFGIPIPIIAILVFFLEPLAHTNDQKGGVAIVTLMVVLGVCFYICDKIPRRLVFWLGIFGWILALGFGVWFFKTHGP